VQRLGDDTDRVREVHEERARRDLLDRSGVPEHRGDRPHRHREAAGAGRLLAEDAVLQRELLVVGPRAILPGADRGEDEPSVREGGARVGVAADLERPAPRLTEEPPEGGHRLEPGDVGVVQHDLGQPELILVADEPAQHEGRADPRAEHRELHATHGTGRSRRPLSR
jgi:hypothetical protein